MRSLFAILLAVGAVAMSAKADVESALHVVYAKARIVEAVDADSDGLADATEAAIGSDPAVADTDGDGLSDGDEEILLNTSAVRADGDGDGFGDGLEVAAGSDPFSVGSVPVTVSGTIVNGTSLAGSVIANLLATNVFDWVVNNSATSQVCRTFTAESCPVADFAFANAVASGVAFCINAWADVNMNGEQDAWEPAGGISLSGVSTPEIAGVAINLVCDDNVASETVDGTTWTYVVRDGNASICNSSSGAVTIAVPSVFSGCSVTDIGPCAFFGCNNLTSVTIPGGVTNVDDSAFCGCNCLTNVTILGALDNYAQSNLYDATPQELTTYVTANWTGPADTWQGRAVEYLTHRVSFDSNGGEGEMGSQKVIWYGTTNIVLNAFVHEGHGFLGWATSPDGEVVYADGAEIAPENDMTLYAVWKALAPVLTIENGVLTGIDLNGCSDIVIPDGVTSIGGGAFKSCANLVSVSLPASLASIGGGAFEGCTSLAALRFKSDAPAVAAGAFEGMNPACVIYVPDNSVGWFAKDDGTWMGMSLEYSDDVVVPAFGESGKMDVAFAAKQTPQGVLHGMHGASVGTVALKVAKLNKKKGVVKIGATVSMVVKGKVKNVKAKDVSVEPGGVVEATFAFAAPIGEMKFEMDEEGNFSLGNDSYRMRKADVGGKFPEGELRFAVAVDALPSLKDGMEAVAEALPVTAVLKVTNEKKQTMDFGKAGSLKIAQGEDGGYELVGFDDEKKPNFSALKMQYSPKTGVFKGSFKAYFTDLGNVPAGKKPKMKKVTVNFAGFVADEGAGAEGFGEAYMSSPVAGPWKVWIY